MTAAMAADGAVMRVAMLCLGGVLSTVVVVRASSDLRLIDAVRSRNFARAQALLAEPVDPSAEQADGTTALHWAAHGDDDATADLLIRAGARVDAINDYGVTPLAAACQNGSAASARIVKRLLAAGADPDRALPSGETALMTASLTGNVEAVTALLAGGANADAKESLKGQTALMWAASEGHADVVRALLDGGADVNARSMGQFTPIMFAARAGDIGLVRMLLTAGADINANAADGSTPLLVAVFRGHVDLAKALLEAGGDANAAASDSGYTALHWAAGKMESHETVPYAQSDGEWAALIGIPAEKGQLDLMQALLVHGADPNARSGRGAQARSSRSRVDPFSDTGATPFWLAARAGDVAAMRLLAAHGADPLLAADDGTTPLIAAAGGATLFGKRLGFNALVQETSRIEAYRLALELGADINRANEQGNTALHAAAFSNLAKVAAFLIAQGAKVNLRNDLGDTPLKIAEGFQAAMTVATSPEVAEILRKAGGVARPGPSGLYDRASAESNASLRKLLEERAELMNQLEALERRMEAARGHSDDDVNKLRVALASKDVEIAKIADANFIFYEDKRGQR